MGKLAAWWRVIHEAFNLRFLIVAGAIFGAVKLVEWIAEHLEKAQKFTSINIGIPPLAVGIFAVLILFVFMLIQYATQQNEKLTPKIKASFDPSGGGIVQSPIKHTESHPQAYGLVTKTEGRAVYVRGTVRCESGIAVKNCVAFLTGVKQRNSHGDFVDTPYRDNLQLEWSMGGVEPIDIPSGVIRYFNIVMIESKKMQPQLTVPWPLTLRKLFDDKTTYQLNFVISGDGVSVFLKMEFTWTGDLDAVTGQQL